MSKHLRIWLFALLGTLLASTTLLAQGVITMTTSKAVGETVKLRIEANGNVTIEGVKELPQLGKDKKNYTLTSQTITIHGDVTKLDCSDNQLTSLDLPKSTVLTWLWCSGNQLTSLDLSNNTALTTLGCSNNQLTSLDLPKNTALTTLYCDRNQLTRLDVSKNAALTELGCSENQLTSLDVSKNTALTTLFCFENKLTSLDVSKNIALTELYCSNNQLTSLNVSRCARLNTLYCDSNRINGKAMNKLVNSLPNRRRKSSGAILLVDNSPEKRDKNRCSPADVTTARRKNWEVLKLESSKIRAF
ncbi:leucine-rich repeat domain-containing protein [Porphyromonas asaccharolytica]|uniref:Immunoreactive 47 kDa antigen n=1 Tax=Porphyromonas asaccharolytica (strain ATCC 25260 / DSM 20707 / BCRC 10618 / CCUG 7834 / JCM 6326 / LMG 13178 / VPI 4198 / B440) TaxID=879243 RepID=F4KKR2_PORAD|nr:leucine-rich repeat domain-containing protein [Porphyromonas asaccharolytica]AEE12987.1 immunoreactive 47 kDa antigen [Porphyromonas asaccharolytica DSM 20707]